MSNELKMNEAKLQKLLQVKRLESPGQPYMDAFLDEFHRYQRADILKTPSLLERLQSRVEDLFFFQPRKTWAMGSGFAALLLLVSITVVQLGDAGSVSSPSAQAAATSGIQSDKVQLVSDSSFERDFSSPRYVTGQTPLSYDTALAF